MEDYGDFLGMQGYTITQTLASQVIMEMRMNRRYGAAYADKVAQAVDDANRDAENLRDALADGPNDFYDLSDGKAQTYTFDLSSYEGEDRDAVLDSIMSSLEENGFDPGGLIPETIMPASTGGPGSVQADPVPTGRYFFTFADGDAERFSRVLDSYIPNAFERGGIAARLGFDSAGYSALGFGQLDRDGRMAFLEGLQDAFRSSGLAEYVDSISVSRNEAGELAGDLSVPKDHGAVLKDYCGRYNAEHGTRVCAVYEVSPASTGVSYDDAFSVGDDLSKALIRNGFVDPDIKVTRNGAVVLKCNAEDAPRIRDAVDRYNAMESERSFRKSQSRRKADGATQSWSSKKSHIKAAEAAEQAISPKRIPGADTAIEDLARAVRPKAM